MSMYISNRQRRLVGFDTAWLRKRAAVISTAADIDDSEVCVLLVSNRRIHELNLEWRGMDKPTDVLSFPQNEGDFAELHSDVLGDVVISLEQADHQRSERTLMDEVTHLLIHGVLHLLGHDHAEPEETRTMRAEEERIWSALRTEESK